MQRSSDLSNSSEKVRSSLYIKLVVVIIVRIMMNRTLKCADTLFILTIILILSLPTHTYNEVLSSREERNLFAPSTVHSPIEIDGDSEFALQGWKGNGTKNNPYLIESLTIMSSGESCIKIMNTNSFFIIRNCTLGGASFNEGGIAISSGANGFCCNNTIFSCDSGVLLWFSYM